jgi:hypothetical protein
MLGAVLIQKQEGRERVIAYVSWTLNRIEGNYSCIEMVRLAVKWDMWKIREYLEVYYFVITTDH